MAGIRRRNRPKDKSVKESNVGVKLALYGLLAVLGVGLGAAGVTDRQFQWGMFAAITVAGFALFIFSISRPRPLREPWFWMFLGVWLIVHVLVYLPMLKRGWLYRPIMYGVPMLVEFVVAVIIYYLVLDRIAQHRKRRAKLNV